MADAKPTKLNAESMLYTPDAAQQDELIVLCMWLGAARKTIAKYIPIYQELAPRTPILLIESSIWTITPPYPIQKRKMKENVAALERTLSAAKEANTEAKILIHTFSNGGSNSATQLLLAYHEKNHQPLPIHGMICDSSPSKGEYWKSYNAIRQSLPPSLPFKIVGPLICHFIPSWMYANAAMGRYEVFETLIRKTLLSEEMVVMRKEHTAEQVKGRISYIWSKADKYMEWRDIVGHAEEAKAKEWVVKSEEFEGSAHCGHLRLDEGRYKGIVKDMWST